MTSVTFLSYDDDPPLGGQGVLLHGMRAALAARGLALRTVSGRGDHAVRYPRVTGRAPLDLSLHLNRHPRLVRDLGGEVVHVNGGPGGVILLRDVGAPVVYTANHTYSQAHRRGSAQRLLSPLEALAYRRAAMVLPISLSTARAVNRLGVPSRRIEVIAPGVDGPLDPAPVRDPQRLLFAGRWEAEKGVLDAVAIMRAVLDRERGATAAVAGSGRLARALLEAVEGSAVEVLGQVSRARLRDEFARAAVVVMPSRYEGLGLVALEAQAAGAVVVGYDVDGLRDAVVTPTLVDPGDTGAASDACLDLLRHPGDCAALAAAAQRDILDAHSWDTVAARLEQVYGAVLR